jgi:hypothetical protein
MLHRTIDATHAHLETVLTLPRHEDVFALAKSCREAALVFINDSDHWGKAELAMWLFGPYGQLTEHVSPQSNRGKSATPMPLLRDIDAATVERLLRNTRAEVRQTLETLFDPDGAASFAYSMLATGIVIRCEDTSESPGWAPTRTAQRLADRVLSLFAADYLTQPGDYELELSICSLCRTVSFDVEARLRGTCNRHWAPAAARPSAACSALERATLPYIPELAA